MIDKKEVEKQLVTSAGLYVQRLLVELYHYMYINATQSVSRKKSIKLSRKKPPKKHLFLLFMYDIPHTSDNLATLGALHEHRVIQVNRLS